MQGLVFLIIVALFILFLFGSFSVAGRQSGADGYREDLPRKRSVAGVAQAKSPRISVAARKAMRRARYDSGDAYVRVLDVGLLAYREADEPKLLRSSGVSTDTDYLRPFAVLWVPYQARGTVRMEIVDADGRTRYADETRYDLQQGDNTLLPGTWLPLRGLTAAQADWSLRILVADTMLAEHTFGWSQPSEGLRQYIEADGELSPELQQALAGQSSQGMSLSQLLSDRDG